MPPFLDHRGQQLSEQRRNIQLLKLGTYRAFGNAAQPFVIERFDNVAQQPRGPHPHPAFAGPRCRQETPHRACDIHRLNFARDYASAQKIGAQETRQRSAEAFLVVRDDRRVRDRDSQRMTKQCGHRKPVCQTAYHASLGKGS